MDGIAEIEALTGLLAAVSDAVETRFDPLILLALGMGAMSSMARARLLSLSCLAAGACGAWMLVEGVTLDGVPLWAALALSALVVAGVLEAIVVMIGGREAAPAFWAAMMVGLFALTILMPARALARFGGLFGLARGGLGGVARLLKRGGRHG